MTQERLSFKIHLDIPNAHPPVWMQLDGDPGVFVPDESYPSARHCDYDVEAHSVRGVK